VGFLAALLIGVAVAAALGLGSTRLVCTGYDPEERGIAASEVERTLRQATGVTGFKAPDPEEDAAPAAAPAAHAATAETAAPAHTQAVHAGTTLAGEEELAARKGEWRYEGAKTATPTADVGTRPEALDAPREGKADDLKKIKGVGPKLEQLCNELGFFHYAQIARWTADEVAWVDENLTGFKGRVSRDNWVEQARILAEGGETEFSARVDEGDMY